MFIHFFHVYACAGCFCAGDCQCRKIADATQLFREFSMNSSVSSVNYKFTVHPQGGTYVTGMEVTLSCNITFNDTLGQPAPVSITWEHNGTRVNTGTTSSTLYSRLIIAQFSVSSQGDYICRANNGNYTIVSRTATLQLPSKSVCILLSTPINYYS